MTAQIPAEIIQKRDALLLQVATCLLKPDNRFYIYSFTLPHSGFTTTNSSAVAELDTLRISLAEYDVYEPGQARMDYDSKALFPCWYGDLTDNERHQVAIKAIWAFPPRRMIYRPRHPKTPSRLAA